MSENDYSGYSALEAAMNDEDALLNSQPNIERKHVSLSRDICPVFIANEITGEYRNFPSVPDSVQISNGISWESTDIRLATERYMGYMNTGPRSMSFVLSLHDDLLPLGIMDSVTFIEALLYPKYESGAALDPRAYVRLGKFKLRGVCTSCNITWLKPLREGHYIRCDVSLAFEATTNLSPDCMQVREGHYYER